MTKAELREARLSELHILMSKELEILEYQAQMRIYRKRPDLWLTQRFGEDLSAVIWSDFDREAYSKHTWDGDKNPLYRIWEALARGKWACLASATGIGKTYILARIIYWFLDCWENSLVVTSAPKKDQLTLLLWSEIGESFGKFKKIRPYAELTKGLRLRVDTRQKQDDEDQNAGWQAIGFVAGIKAGEKSATKAQGFHRKNMLIVLEECPGMPVATMEAFKNTSTGDHNMILAVGNPDSVVDPLGFFSIIPGVQTFRASAYDHPNVVLQKEVIPGATGQNSIERRKGEYGEESSFYQSRVRGIMPDQGNDSLIHLSWLVSCYTQKTEFKNDPIKINEKSFNAVGVDVANSDFGDKACLAWGEKNKLVMLHEFQCPSASHLAYNMIDETETLQAKGYTNYKTRKLKDSNIHSSCVGIDAVGVGASTVNAFKDRKFAVIALQGGQVDSEIPKDEKTKEPLYEFANLRSQMYYAAREDLQGRKIIIDIGPEEFRQLCIELTVITFVLTGGKINVERKDDVKKKLSGKSPNKADSFVYWNWMRRGVYRKNNPGLSIPNV